MKKITKKEFAALCEKYYPIYLSDEVNAKGEHWRVYRFKEAKGEYHERVKHDSQF